MRTPEVLVSILRPPNPPREVADRFQSIMKSYKPPKRRQSKITIAAMVRNTQLDKNDGGCAEPSDSCCSRFMDDITETFTCRPSFRAVDGTRNIDVPASFSPRGLWVIAGKTVMLGIVFATLSLNLFVNMRAFWLAYLTNWSVTISTVYLLFSFFNSLLPVSGPLAGETRVNVRVKATWIIFTASANIGLLVTIVFWFIIYNGAVDKSTFEKSLVFPHGILTLAVLIDGFGINAIPIRLRHYLELVVPFELCYMLWSYLHGVFDIGNPDENDQDPDTNDDLIYDVLDWKNNTKATALNAVLLILILSPILQIVIWVISGFRRRYKNPIGSHVISHVETGSSETPTENDSQLP